MTMRYMDDNATLSLSLNVSQMCEDGTLTVLLVVLFFAGIVLARNLLYAATQSAQTRRRLRKGIAAPTERQLTKGRGFSWWLERTLVTPFVPNSLESFVTSIYFWFFVTTITMGVTRFYEERWGGHALVQQVPFNVLAHQLGNCTAINPVLMRYAKQSKTVVKGMESLWQRGDPSEGLPLDESPDIDWFFGYHLFFGVAWMTFGALQMLYAKVGWSTEQEVSNRAHKMFGYFVALPSFVLHTGMSLMMAIRNPVHHISIIQSQYFGLVGESILLAATAIHYARKKNISKHASRMYFCWIQTLTGSGAIRIASWLLWLVSKFFSMENRVLIDRGLCQDMALTGYPAGLVSEEAIEPIREASAQYCWKSVFLNLFVTDLIILWLEWLFMCTNVVDSKGHRMEWDQGDKRAVVSKFKRLLLVLGVYIPLVVMDAPAMIMQGWILVNAGIIKMNTIAYYLASFKEEELKVEETDSVQTKVFKKAVKGASYLYMVDQTDSSSDEDGKKEN